MPAVGLPPLLVVGLRDINMSPDFTFKHCNDICSRNMEYFCKFSLRDTFFGEGKNTKDIFFFQSRLVVSIPIM